MRKLPTDAEMTAANEQFRAEQRGYATSLDYEKSVDSLVLSLRTGIKLTIPRNAIVELKDATQAELRKLVLSATGGTIHCEPLDVDISVPGLVRDLTGAADWLSRAGSKTTAAKSAAARSNGKLGGRPRKKHDQAA